MIRERLLTEEIASVLNISLDGRASVTGGDGHVLIVLTDNDLKHRLGHIFRQVTLIVDEAFPNRPEDIILLFRDKAGRHQHQFRLWHSANAQ
jgi:hypothetical protein